MWPKKSVSRVLFPTAVTRSRATIIHLVSLLPTTSSSQTQEPRANSSQTSLYSTLLRMGFTELLTSPPELVSSYLTLSPLSTFALELWQTVSSLWHFPWGYPRFPLETILSCGARTFLPSAKRTGDRLSFSDHIKSGFKHNSLHLNVYFNVENPVAVGTGLYFCNF